ncbi:MAG: hypothetical protein AABZ39_08665 [Spirochaetota bacterium]
MHRPALTVLLSFILGTTPLVSAPDALTGTNDTLGSVTTHAGRYGSGRSQIPDTHSRAAQAEALSIVSRDAAGAPMENGRIVIACIGFPDPSPDFRIFINYLSGKKMSPALLIVDCSQPKAGLKEWASSSGETSLWNGVGTRLAWFGAAASQVQIAWVHLSGSAMEYDRYQDILKARVMIVLETMRRQFPNLRVAYLTSSADERYTRYPEPYCYRYGHCIRSLILDQIAQNPKLNYDRSRGMVRMPLLLWGPDARIEMRPSNPGIMHAPNDAAPAGTDGRGRSIHDHFLSDPAGGSWFALNVR